MDFDCKGDFGEPLRQPFRNINCLSPVLVVVVVQKEADQFELRRRDIIMGISCCDFILLPAIGLLSL